MIKMDVHVFFMKLKEIKGLHVTGEVEKLAWELRKVEQVNKISQGQGRRFQWVARLQKNPYFQIGLQEELRLYLFLNFG